MYQSTFSFPEENSSKITKNTEHTYIHYCEHYKPVKQISECLRIEHRTTC